MTDAATHTASPPASSTPPAPEWARTLVEAFRKYGVRYLNYVPDAIGEQILRAARGDPDFQIVPLTREEEGVGLLCGQSIGGRRGVLMMPTSGLGNSLNALASLPIPYRIPVPLVIGHRGALGEFNPAQVPMGQAAPEMLDSLRIPHFSLSRPDEVERIVDGALKMVFALESPVALFVSTQLAGWKDK